MAERSSSAGWFALVAVFCSGFMGAQTAPEPAAANTVSGQVIDGSSGVPIVRALVQVRGAAQLTGGEGRFTLPLPVSGLGLVTARKPGYYDSPAETGSIPVSVSAAEADRPVTVRLFREAVITGTVLTRGSEPLPGIRVEARRILFEEAGPRLVTAGVTQTGFDGQFRLTVPAGDFLVQTLYTPSSLETGLAVAPAVFPGGAAAGTTFHLGNGETQSVPLRVVTGRAYTVRVHVEGLTEGQFPRFLVRFPGGTAASLPARFDRATREALFRLLPGSYRLEITTWGPDQRMFGSLPIQVPDHDIAGLAVALTPVPSIPVELLVEHAARSPAQPGADAQDPRPQQLGLSLQSVEWEENRPGSVLLRTSPDGAAAFDPSPGVYRLSGSESSRWRVQSASFGSTPVLGRPFTVAAGAGSETLHVVVSDESGSLRGVTRLAGTPGGGFVVLLPLFPSATPRILLRADTQGIFSASALRPGSYQAVSFEFSPSQDLTDPAVLRSLGAAVRPVTITVGEQATVDLDAIAGEGRPR